MPSRAFDNLNSPVHSEGRLATALIAIRVVLATTPCAVATDAHPYAAVQCG